MNKFYLSIAMVAATMSVSVAKAQLAELSGKKVVSVGTRQSGVSPIVANQWYVMQDALKNEYFASGAAAGDRLSSLTTAPVVDEAATSATNGRVLLRFIEVGTSASNGGGKTYRIQFANGFYASKMTKTNDAAGGSSVAAEASAGLYSFPNNNIFEETNGAWVNRSRTYFHGWATALNFPFSLTPVKVGTPVNITVNHVYNGHTITETKKAIAEETLDQATDPLERYGLTGTSSNDLTQLATEGAVVTYNYTLNPAQPIPFSYYDSYAANNTFYTMQVKGKYAQYRSTVAAATNAAQFGLGDEAGYNSDFQFQYVGNPLEGFKIYNKTAGGTHALGIQSPTKDNACLNLFDSETPFELRERGGQYFFRAVGSSNYINYRDPNLSTWNDERAYTVNTADGVAGDAGSRVIFTAISTAFFQTRFDEAKATLAQYKNANVSALFDQTVVTNEENRLNALAAPASPEDLDARLAEVAKSKNTIVNSTNGKTVTFVNRNYSGHKLTLGMDDKFYTRSTAVPADEANNVFRVVKTSDGVVALQSVVTNEYLTAKTAQNDPYTASATPTDTLSKFTFEVATVGSAVYLGINAPALGATNYASHAAGTTDHPIVRWSTVSSSEPSGWTVAAATVSATDITTAAQNRLAHAKSSLGYTLGSALGQYTTGSLTAAQTAAESSTDLATIAQAVRDYNSGHGYTIVQPEGKFVRIKGNYNGTVGYLSLKGAATAYVHASAAAGDSTVFYVKSGKLYSFATGKLPAATTDNNAVLPVAAFGSTNETVAFSASPRSGKYYIDFVGGTRVLRKDATKFKSNPLSWRSATDASFDFTLEEVTALPVTIGSTGYATFAAPVAVTVPAGVNAYVATAATTSQITLAPISGNVIPANTPVILQGSGEVLLTQTTAAGTTPATNVFQTVTDAAPVTDDQTYFYSNVEGIFRPAATTLYKRPFISFVTVSGVSVQGIGLGFNTTAIDAIDATSESTLPTFDLQGRIVTKTTKGGIYVRNGKTFIQR